jgi:hypothetical protein
MSEESPSDRSFPCFLTPACRASADGLVRRRSLWSSRSRDNEGALKALTRAAIALSKASVRIESAWSAHRSLVFLFPAATD